MESAGTGATGRLAESLRTACDPFSGWRRSMWEMEPGRLIIWSPDPSSVEALTAVLCRRVSYDEGAKWQVTDSPPLNGQMTAPPGS